jgi:hypothetical protein
MLFILLCLVQAPLCVLFDTEVRGMICYFIKQLDGGCSSVSVKRGVCQENMMIQRCPWWLGAAAFLG